MAENPELHFSRGLTVAYDAALRVLRAGPEAWLPAVEHRERDLTMRLRWSRVSRLAVVRTGSVQPFAYGVSVRVEWEDAQHPALYPRLEGHLRVEHDPDGSCRLRFDARYAPPARALGGSADRALLHRIARASTEAFVDGVAERLVAGTPP